MKLPRDVSGAQLIKALERLDTGSFDKQEVMFVWYALHVKNII